ncbi:MAG: ABC transporter permease [Candidatus Aenigmarchaeota archaeon]|nr:ABC transporter permease [Candidatus Aenigmarchaeota archaeon]
MIDFAFKNITRQRTRTILTTLGIIIGIAAIVALGSISEGINQYITASLELSAGKIIIQQRGSGGFQGGFAGSDITDDDLEELGSIDGVKEIVPMNLYFSMGRGMSFGPGMVIAGIDPERSEFLVGENIEMHEGREMEGGETGVMMLGFVFAEQRDLGVGDYFELKDMEFEIIGILEKIENPNVDDSASVNIVDIQELMGVDTYQMAYVVPFDIRDAEAIAEEIENSYEKLSATTPVELARQVGEIITQIRLFTLGIGGIAAVVGGLGVLNTMIMAVLERRREIGVMKAIGATKRRILMQILTESAMISLIGGALGLAIGALVVFGIVLASGGQLPAQVTPGLAAGSMIFALMLGIVGGVYPSIKAANLDPVEALRYE